VKFDILTFLIVVDIIVLIIIVKKYYKLTTSYAYIGMKYIKKGKLAKAAKYLSKAADNGDPVCAYNIGLLYFEGDAVLLNKLTAVKYFKMASSNAGKGDFKVPEHRKKTDKRELQNKSIKSKVKKIWKAEELWRLDGASSAVLNY